MSPPHIEGLRRRLAAVDGELQRAIGRRLRLARAIGAQKRRLGLPLRDLELERTVVGRWQAALEREGVQPARAARVARWMVQEAVRAQRPISSPAPRRSPRAPLEVLVIGGVGAMGRWLVNRLTAAGHHVAVLDPNAEGVPLPPRVRVLTSLDAALTSDVVIVATPISAASAIYEALIRRRTPATIFDVLSVKAPIQRWVRAARARGIAVGSLHPMFGPRSFDVSGRVVLVVDCGDRSANRLAHELLGDGGLRLVPVPLAQHDRWMAELQALPRLAGLGFAGGLSGRTKEVQRRAQVGPPSFQRQLEITRTSLGEDARLTWDLLHSNPHARGAADRLVREVKALRKLLVTEDADGFQRRLRRGRVAVGRPGRVPPATGGGGGRAAIHRRPARRGRRRRATGGGRSRATSRPTSRGGSPA